MGIGRRFLLPFIHQGVSASVGLDRFVGVYLIHRLPRIVSHGIALPLHEVLQLIPSAKESMAYDGLDLVFRLASDQIRWRPREVGAMRGRFAIRDQYGRV